MSINIFLKNLRIQHMIYTHIFLKYKHLYSYINKPHLIIIKIILLDLPLNILPKIGYLIHQPSLILLKIIIILVFLLSNLIFFKMIQIVILLIF
jgi:hypothetical protein